MAMTEAAPKAGKLIDRPKRWHGVGKAGAVPQPYAGSFCIQASEARMSMGFQEQGQFCVQDSRFTAEFDRARNSQLPLHGVDEYLVVSQYRDAR